MKEITDTVRRAFSLSVIDSPKPREKIDGDRLFKKLVDLGKDIGEADIWEASPIRLGESPETDHVLLLETLYRGDEFLFIGQHDHLAKVGVNLRQAHEWAGLFRQTPGIASQFIIPNPLSGEPDANGSLRSDACVEQFRFAVIEFDQRSRAEQLAFFAAVHLPFHALIDTGGKSIHGWIEIDHVNTEKQWTKEVEWRLFGKYLIPLGADPACRNEARLSRLPGAFRREKQATQKLLWLSPTGRRIMDQSRSDK
jgi:hypothetical protein